VHLSNKYYSTYMTSVDSAGPPQSLNCAHEAKDRGFTVRLVS